MTKDEIASQITNANTTIVFALLSLRFPFLKIPIVSWVVKYYLSKWFKPVAAEGTVFVAFKVIDWNELEKAKTFNEAMQRLANAMSVGGISEDLKDAEDNFDNSFRDAIRIKP